MYDFITFTQIEILDGPLGTGGNKLLSETNCFRLTRAAGSFHLDVITIIVPFGDEVEKFFRPIVVPWMLSQELVYRR